MKTTIAALRKKIGLTQEELAKKAGVARQTIIALGQGRYNPSFLLAVKISRLLQAKNVEDVFDPEI